MNYCLLIKFIRIPSCQLLLKFIYDCNEILSSIRNLRSLEAGKQCWHIVPVEFEEITACAPFGSLRVWSVTLVLLRFK